LQKRENLMKGLAYGLVGYALLSFGDFVVKSMAHQWPVTAIAALRYIFGAIGIATLLFWKEGRKGFSCPAPLVQLGRGVSVAFGSVFFFLAISHMSLAEATVIQFLNPIIVALLSALILKERAGRVVWIAAMLAFAGVVIVIRPSFANIGFAGLYPLVAAVFIALLAIFNRMAAGKTSALQAQMLISAIAAPILICFAGIGHASGLSGFVITMPPPIVIAKCAIIACTASLAHALIYKATEYASAASIAPVVYVQLLIAVVLGAVFMGVWPDLPVYLGSVFIIGAGIFLWRDAKQKGNESS
jgi:drug/metabolite transporter (DMT)-like permease